MTPLELSTRFIEAYNRRDPEALRSLLADDITYLRPGPRAVGDADAVVANYQREWKADIEVTVRRATESADAVVVEITATQRQAPYASYEAAAYHRWADGKMVEYRAYLDPQTMLG